jgi:hypothetical protein
MRFLAVIAVVLLASAAASASTGPQTESETAAARAAALIRQIHLAPTSERRASLASELRLAERIEPRDAGGALVDGLAGLLDDRESWVQMWAATALAALGPPARRTVPLLKAAAERKFRERYGDHPALIAGTGIHAHWVIVDAAIQLEYPELEQKDRLGLSFGYIPE